MTTGASEPITATFATLVRLTADANCTPGNDDHFTMTVPVTHIHVAIATATTPRVRSDARASIL